MRRLFALFTMAVVSVCLYSQTPEEWNVPQNYSLVNAEDYAPYNEDVVKCVDWLVNTPLDLQTSKRRDAHKFLMAWIGGSPEVMVIVSEDLVPFLNREIYCWCLWEDGVNIPSVQVNIRIK